MQYKLGNEIVFFLKGIIAFIINFINWKVFENSCSATYEMVSTETTFTNIIFLQTASLLKKEHLFS